MYRFTLFLFLIANFCLPIAYGCGPGGRDEPFARVEELIVFYDSSLYKVMQEIFLEFNNTHKNLQVRGKSSGSRELAYIILEGREKPDLLFVADPQVFEDLLLPEYVDWYIKFGKNSLILVFTQESRYADRINQDNWFEILSYEDVRIGRTEENLSCLGYHTLLSWQLAKDYYRKEDLYERLYKNSFKYIYPQEEQVVAFLESFDLDYAFVYLSTAKTKNLKYIELPEEVNLSKNDLAGIYQRAAVRLTGKNREEFIETKALPISYAFSIPKNISYGQRSPYILEFLNLVFSKKGKEVFARHGFSLESLSLFEEKKLPSELKGYVTTSN